MVICEIHVERTSFRFVEMAWFSDKISLGGFPDLTGAVNKFQESVKNIEKNFDNALGFDDKSESAGEGTF